MVVHRYINAYPVTGLADSPVATRYGTFSRLLVCSLVLLVALNSDAGNRPRTRIGEEPSMNVPEKATVGTSVSRAEGGAKESTPKHFTRNLSESQESLNDASMPPKNDRVRAPDRRIHRPQWESAASSLRSTAALLAGNDYLVLRPRNSTIRSEFVVINADFSTFSIDSPNDASTFGQVSTVGRRHRVLFSTKKCVLKKFPSSHPDANISSWLVKPSPPPDPYIRLYGIDDKCHLVKLSSIDVQELLSEFSPKNSWHYASLALAESGSGYVGLLQAKQFEQGVNNRNLKVSRRQSVVINWDQHLDVLNKHILETVNEAKDLVSSGISKSVAALIGESSFTFVTSKGEEHRLSIEQSPGQFSSPLPITWERPGIVEGSEYFAVARNDRATLPVFDLSVWPPELVHSYRVGTLMPAGMTSLIVGKWLYAKEGASTTIRGINLQNKDMKRKKFLFTESLEDGWKKTIPGTDLWFAFGAFGYWKGNIIVPARTNIYFLDEKTGEINYRFCLVEDSGNSLLPKQRWYDLVWPEWERERYMDENSRYFRVTSFELFNGHLFAITNKPETPIYVWKLPTSPE